MAIITASGKFRERIKQYEGFRPEPYDDGTGTLTIGYGDTKFSVGKKRITPEEAEADLENHIKNTEEEVSNLVTRDDLTEDQKDALLDLHYNVGAKTLNENKFYDRVNSGKDDEVYQAIGKYTKARVKGKLVDLQHLKERAIDRQMLYGGSAPLRGVSPGAQPVDFDQLADESQVDFNQLAEESKGVDFNQLADESEEEDGGSVQRPSKLNEARIVSKDFDIVKQQENNAVREKYKISEPEATALLSNNSFKDVMSASDIDEIDTDYPGAKEWASKPKNYPLLKQDPRWAKNVEQAAGSFKDFVKDLGPSAWFNSMNMLQMSVHTQMALGNISVEDGVPMLNDLQMEIDKHPITRYKKGVQEISKGIDSLGTRLSRDEQIVRAAYKMGKEDHDKIAPALMAAYIAANDSFMGMLDFATSVKRNPGAMALISSQSAGSMVAPFVGASLGSAFLGPGLGSLVGGALGGFPVAYGQFIHQEMQNYPNPAEFYADKENLKKVKQKATTYALTHSIFDGVSEMFAGSTITKTMKKIADAKGKMNIAGKAIRIGAAGLKEVGKQAATEGVGETTALFAAGKPASEAIKEGTVETASSLPISGFHAVLGYASKKTFGEKSNTEKLGKMTGTAVKAVKTLTSYDALKTLRANKESSELSKSNPQQTKELIDSSMGQHRGYAGPDENYAYVEGVPENASPEAMQKTEAEDIDAFAGQEVRTRNNESDPLANVQINVTEWENFHKKKGLDPYESIRAFGEEAVEAYRNAKTNNGDFSVPVSDYLRYTEDNPDLDTIVRVDGDEFNASEAEEVLDTIEKNYRTLFSPKTGEEPPEFKFEEGEPEEGDPVLRPIELIQRFRSDDEKAVYTKIHNQLRKSLPFTKVESGDYKATSGTDPEVVQVMAELQFRHTRYRSEVTGIPILQLADSLRISGVEQLDARGVYKHGNFLDTVRKIVFNKQYVDTPTIVHEFAHSWLDEMAIDWQFISRLDPEKMTQRQRDYAEAMTSTADLLALGTIGELRSENVDESKYRRAHETFAQTAEKYFLEGTFANTRIKKIFEIMRKWMQPFIDIIGKSYPQFPSLIVSPKVERIFEILTDASNTVEEIMGSMYPEPMFDPAILGVNAEKYMNAIKDARDSVLGGIYSKIMHRSLAERERLVEKELNKIYAQATEQVETMPAMQLMEAFKKLAPEARISILTFKEVFKLDDAKMDALREILPKQFFAGAKKGGRDVREVMAELEINDPAQLLTLMTQAGKKESIIEERAEQIIKDSFPAFKTDDEIHDIAVEEINGEGRERLLQLELKQLAEFHLADLKKLIKTAIMPPTMANRISMESIKTKALGIALKSRALFFKPRDLLKLSSRYGRQAADAFSKGNILLAFENKQREAVYFHAFNMGLELQKKIAKTTGHIKRMMKVKDDRIVRYFDIDIYNFGRRTIQAASTGKPLPIFSEADFPRSGVVDHNRVSAINSLLGATTQGMNGRPLLHISVDDYLALGEALSMIRSAAAHSKSAILAGRSMNREAAVSLISEEIGERRDSDPEKAIGVYKASLLSFRTLIDGLFKSEGSAGNSGLMSVFNAVSAAQATFTKHKNAGVKALREAAIKMAEKDTGIDRAIAPILRRLPLARFKDKYTPPIASHELNVTFKNGISDVLGMILHLGSQSGKEKFLLGGVGDSGPLASIDLNTGKIDDTRLNAFIDRLIEEGTLRKEHFEFAETVWAFFKEHYPAAKEAYHHIYGSDLGKIEAQPISTPWGTYSGGYIPAAKDGSYADLVASYSEFSIDDVGHQTHELFPTSAMGFTKQRTQQAYPLNLSLENLPTQYHRVLQLAYLKKTMFETGKILNHPLFRQAMEGRRPGTMRQIVEPWFNRVMAQQYSIPSRVGGTGIDPIIHALRKNMRIAAFFLNFKTYAKQYLGLIQSADTVNPKYMVRASARVKLRPGVHAASIANLSPRMQLRFEQGQRQYTLAFDKLDLNGDWLSWTNEKIEKLTYFAIQAGQTHIDTILWLAAREQAHDIGIVDTQKAIDYADNIVERTQMSADIASRPSMLHGTEFERAITDFTSVPLAMFGLNAETYYRNLDQPGRIRAERYLKTLLITAMIPGVIGAMIGGLLRPSRPDDDEEDYASDMAAETINSVIDVHLPVVGRAAVSVLKGDPLGAIPLLRSLKQVGLAVQGLGQASEGVELTPRHIKAMNDAVILFTGIPILSSLTIPLRIGEAIETPQEKRKLLKRRRKQLARARKGKR